MGYQFSFFEIIVVFGILQGLIISILILKNKQKSASKLLLSLILIVFVLLSAKMLLLTTKLNYSPYLRYFPRSFELLIQPLIWLYIRSLVIVKFKLEKKYWIHVIPFSLFFGYSIFIYCYTFNIEGIKNKDLFANSLYFNEIKKVEDFLSVVSSLLYWIIGFIQVIQYRKWLNEQTSNTDFPTFSWVKNISILMGLLIIILLVDVLVDSLFGFKIDLIPHWKIFFIYISGIIYYMGLKGYFIPDNPPYLGQLIIQQQIESPSLILTTSKINSKKATSIDQWEEIGKKIDHVLNNDKLYLNPELSLQTMAIELKVSESVLSALINNRFHKSFRTLINEYRVEEVKKKLKDPHYRNFSILGIAYKCGFNSEASFYRIFKSTTGLSPKAFMESQ